MDFNEAVQILKGVAAGRYFLHTVMTIRGKNTLRLKHPHTIMLTSIHQWGCTIQEIHFS